MNHDLLIKIISTGTAVLCSFIFLYCIFSLYKTRKNLLWIKNKQGLIGLIILTAIVLILNIGMTSYANITGNGSIIILSELMFVILTVFMVFAGNILIQITEVFDRNQQLVEEKISDESMGIYNRAYFVIRLKEEFTVAKRHNSDFSVLLVGVDYFEKINKSYGIDYSRKFIRNFSEFIKLSLRETDIIARFDREEVIILLQNTGKEGAKIAAGKIQNAIENKTFYIETGNEFSQIMIACTVSIGVASYSSSIKNSDQMIEQADVALFKARDRGRNQVAIYGE